MATRQDLICSEVHTFSESCSDAASSVFSKFRFSNPTRDLENVRTEIEYDSDGDVVVARAREAPEDEIVIEHDLSTPLEAVGRQVWRGSLILADFLLHNHTQMRGSKMLELGSGTGLTSIVAAICGFSATATDIPDESILKRIQSNIDRNQSLFPDQHISVQSLDLKKDTCSEDFDYILAGDLIYDDAITDALVNFLQETLIKFRKTKFLISLEKRYVFTLKELDTVAPAYQHFLQKITRFKDFLTIEFIDTDFKQYFCYDRSDEMVMMVIKAINDD